MSKRFADIDFGLWVLLAMNIYLIWYYLKVPGSIDTIILLFYVQSVLIGVFNVLDMLTLTNVANKEGVTSKKGCAAGFFAIHYGGFHFVYLFFLVTTIHFKNLDSPFIYLSLWVLLANAAIGFIQNKIRNRTEAASVGAMFFMPYPRIIPMHLFILAPAFLNISAPLLFLVLKTIADVVMYIVCRKIVFRPVER